MSNINWHINYTKSGVLGEDKIRGRMNYRRAKKARRYMEEHNWQQVRDFYAWFAPKIYNFYYSAGLV